MNYFELTQTFIEKSNYANNLLELTNLFGDFCKKLGCTHFVCLSHVNPLDPPEDAVVLTNYPLEWAKHHGANQYHRYDPIMETCKTSVQPFEWSNYNWRAKLYTKQLDMLNEAAEFDLVNGYTIPIQASKGYPASLSIVYKQGELSPDALPTFQLLAYFIYEKALSMKVAHLKEERTMLSPQERRVLESLSKGKSNWTISKLMGVSENTIKKHVKGIYKKYGVATRPQAAIKGVFLGDINYFDVMNKQSKLNTKQSNFIHIQSKG